MRQPSFLEGWDSTSVSGLEFLVANQGLKPLSTFHGLRGAEAPLFHGRPMHFGHPTSV
jgi:hypothetical protein